MKVGFWGTRGSIPKSSSATLRYGGNTSCLEVRTAAGTLVVLDCGTGAHGLGQALASAPAQPVRGSLLISHTHWDHIQGIPFFAPMFVPGNEWDVYAPRGLRQSIRETLAGQMQYTYFPVSLEAMGATVRYHDLVEGTFEIDDVRVRTRYLNHPALTLGYRLEADGVAMVYACDHEPVSQRPIPGDEELRGRERHHVEFLEGADLVVHDAQFTAAEYADRIGWGHGTAEYAAEVCRAAGVKRLALTHHDPNRDDEGVDAMIASLRDDRASAGHALEIGAAAEGDTIDLGCVSSVQARPEHAEFSAVAAMGDAIARHCVALGAVRPGAADVIRAAAQAEGVRVVSETTADGLLRLIGADPPSLVILDASSTHEKTPAVWRALRATTSDTVPPVPIVIVAERDEEAPDVPDPDVEWLIWPFREPYARTKIRAWMLRRQCQWQMARVPRNEEARLAALHALRVLDTEPDERFDRITRMASAALDVPIAVISLVDRDRQWFKSCVGLDVRETPREMAFCAHAIIGDGILVVPDALVDPRFADNPLVTGGPRVRFYAGCPLTSAADFHLGTLCVIDVRPRHLDGRQLALLRDLASLVEEELSILGGES